MIKEGAALGLLPLWEPGGPIIPSLQTAEQCYSPCWHLGDQGDSATHAWTQPPGFSASSGYGIHGPPGHSDLRSWAFPVSSLFSHRGWGATLFLTRDLDLQPFSFTIRESGLLPRSRPGFLTPQPQSGIPHRAPIPDRAVHCQKHSVWEKRLKASVL